MNSAYYNNFPSVLKEALQNTTTSFNVIENDLEYEFEQFCVFIVIFRNSKDDDFTPIDDDFLSHVERYKQGTYNPKKVRGLDDELSIESFLADIGEYSVSVSTNLCNLSTMMKLNTKPERHVANGKLIQDLGIIKRKNESNGHVHCWKYQTSDMKTVFNLVNINE